MLAHLKVDLLKLGFMNYNYISGYQSMFIRVKTGFESEVGERIRL